MLTETQYRQYVTFTHQLSAPAKEYLWVVRNSEPSRMVGVHARNNICSWIMSAKMRQTISSESRTAETAFIVLCEYDDSVLEIWDQPEPTKIMRLNRRGTARAVWYTPDFLILTTAGPRVVEVKPRDVIEKLLKGDPNNWQQPEDGSYRYLPAFEAFAKKGLVHQVFVYEPEQRIRIANLELMMRSRTAKLYEPELPLRLSLAFDESFSWSLSDLRGRLGLDSYTSLIQLADMRKVFFDIDCELLSEPKGCFFAPNQALVQQAAELRAARKIYQVGNVGPLPMERFPSHHYAMEVLRKLERIELGDVPDRTGRRWKMRIENGRKRGLTPFQSLISRKYLSGNRRSRVGEQVNACLNAYLLEEHAPAQGLGMYRSYTRYVVHARERHPFEDPVSRQTFSIRLKQIPANVIARLRQGRRGANQMSDPTDPALRALKPQLAWQSAAIDHYNADIYLVFFSSQGTVYVARPWITAMVDLYSGRVLAIALSFRAPSRNSCAKVMRACVREHGRLPKEIIVDRGSDFTSVYFASLIAHNGMTLSIRAAAHPRYGAEVEGFFGEFKKQWLSQRPGNLADYKEARSVDGKLHPREAAVLQPGDLLRELKAFCAWRDAKPRGAHLDSALDRFERSQCEYPFVAIPCEYDSEFLLVTAVESSNYKVDFQKGIHIDGLHYTSPAIAKIRGKKSHLEVRRDPENPYVIYALVENNWEPCYCTQINTYAALDPIAQAELGLVIIEATNLQRQVRQEYDIKLVEIVREMDALRAQGQVPMAIVGEAEPDPDASELGAALNVDNLRVVSVGEW